MKPLRPSLPFLAALLTAMGIAAPAFAQSQPAQSTAPLPALPQPAPQPAPAPPSAAQQQQDAAAQMATEALDTFRAYCLASLADPKKVRDRAKETKYAPVEPDVVKRLGTDEAWYVPSENGSIILGLSGKGNCGVVVQSVDVDGFGKLLEARLPLNQASDEVKNGLRTRVYSMIYDNRASTVRYRHNADSSKLAPVSVSVSDSKPVQTPAPRQPGQAQRQDQAGQSPQVAAAPRSTPQRQAPPQRTGQIAFPGKPAIDAWDPNKKVLENRITDTFSDACYNTRAQPTDVLTRAQQQKWRSIPTRELGGGIDFAWSTPEAPPEQMLVFYDSRKPRCCVAAFGVKKTDLLTAATRRFALAPERAYAVGAKEVVQFKPRKDYQMAADFEAAEDGSTFANLCYAGIR